MKLRPAKLARPTQRSTGRAKRIDVDLFAGGGGASEGKRRATGRSPHVALNHWPIAIAMHKVNHADCEHYIEDIRDVPPLVATKGALVRFLWASPTCVYFSRASGKRLSPEAVKIRALANVLLPWLDETCPEIVFLENVVEFLGWGPVYETHAASCPGAHDETGDSCADACKYGRPIPELRGTLFEEWRAEIELRGYSFEYRVLTAWEYGSPTTRERVYITMCRGGRSFEWPTPTHSEPELAAETGLKPWRTAAEIIDWSIPCPSIFDRKTPHVAATRRRIAKGMRKFVLEAAQPFLMHLTHGDRHAPHSVEEPVRTVTAANRGEQSLVVPYMIHRSNGERPGQEPRTYDVRAPHPTAVAGGIKTAPVVAFLAKAYSERRPNEVQGSAIDEPIHTVTQRDHHHLVAAHTVKFYGTSTGQQLSLPLHAVTSGGLKHGVVAASLLRYNGERHDGEVRGQSLDEPVSTIDTARRLALLNYECAVEWNDIIAAKARRVYRFLVDEGVLGPWLDHENQIVRLPGTDLVIYDIGMRMLVPRELFRANGFTDEYVIEFIGPNGKPLTKTDQVRLVGNSVCPDVAEALYRAALRMLGPNARRAA